MNDGILGISYAHTTSAPGDASRIAARWTGYWEPLCVLQSKREDDPAAAFRVLRDAFTRRIRSLLSANITWTVIRASNLDDPRVLGTEFDRSLCLAIERRRCRIGWSRKKGAKKHAHAK